MNLVNTLYTFSLKAGWAQALSSNLMGRAIMGYLIIGGGLMVLAALAFVGEMFITDIFFLMMDPLAKPIYIGNDEQGMWSII